MSALKAPRLRVPYQGEIVDVRALIKDRSMELGYSFQNLSVEIGRAKGWLADFVNKGSPRRLAEEDREKLATMLQLHPDQLREGGVSTPRAETMATLSPAEPRTPGRLVPLYEEDEALDPTTAAVWLQPFLTKDGPAAGAIRIHTPVAGRLVAGDICFTKSGLEINPGNLVVLMTEADARIAAIGIFHRLNQGAVEITRDTKAECFPLSGSRLLKIVGTMHP